jgi:CheY-like chemotaxis protein
MSGGHGHVASFVRTVSDANDMPIVLVVDDHDDHRESLTMLLEAAGYRVLEARNGDDALRVLREGPKPCLILLDMLMPVKSGEDFLAEQRANPDLTDVPTVILSGATARSDLEGIAGSLPKPVDVLALLDVVATHC